MEHRLAAISKDGEYMEIIRDIFDSEIFQSMDRYRMHGTTSCKEHCIDVSYITYRICKKRGLDYRRAARAALLHDFFLYDWHTHFRDTGDRFHGLTHPAKARDNAVKYFDIGEMEQNMILRHMWPLTPIPPRSAEGLVLLFADKVCSLRETIEGIRNRIASAQGA